MGKKTRRKKIAKEVDYSHFISVASEIAVVRAVADLIGLDNFDPREWESEIAEISRIAYDDYAQIRVAVHDADYSSPDVQACVLVNISYHCLYLAQETVACFLDDDADDDITAKTTLH